MSRFYVPIVRNPQSSEPEEMAPELLVLARELMLVRDYIAVLYRRLLENPDSDTLRAMISAAKAEQIQLKYMDVKTQ